MAGMLGLRRLDGPDPGAGAAEQAGAVTGRGTGRSAWFGGMGGPGRRRGRPGLLPALALLLLLASPPDAAAQTDPRLAEDAFRQGDYRAAYELYLALAGEGDALAQYRLGLIHDRGLGVPVSYSLAAMWFRSAAQLGQPDAQNALGLYYLQGRFLPRDGKAAEKLFLAAAELGHARAMRNLGDMYLNGEPAERRPEEAARWYERAAALGHVIAMRKLGDLYLHGPAVGRNPPRGIEMLQRAASGGDLRAAYLLALQYRSGRHVRRDWDEAARLFELAGRGGNPDARIERGRMHLLGEGGPVDPVLAWAWFASAEQERPARVEPYLVQARIRMSPEEMARARGLVVLERGIIRADTLDE